MFSLAESSVQLSRFTPLNLLVLGWGDSEFMSQLLLALGTGRRWAPQGVMYMVFLCNGSRLQVCDSLAWQAEWCMRLRFISWMSPELRCASVYEFGFMCWTEPHGGPT